MRMLVAAHRSDAKYSQPEVTLLVLWCNLIQEVAFPCDVVVDVHETHDDIHDPDHEIDDPVRRAGGLVFESICDCPDDHADQSSRLSKLVCNIIESFHALQHIETESGKRG